MHRLDSLLPLSLAEIGQTHPQLIALLRAYGAPLDSPALSLQHCLDSINDEVLQNFGTHRQHLWESLSACLATQPPSLTVSSITLFGGQNKHGTPERLMLRLERGSITSIVGPTGSGKSRLLADIEWMAQGDTPTRRHLLVNDAPPSPADRFSLERKFVAQLSQNMNFVMDASVGEFIKMHAESRQRHDPSVVPTIIAQANALAGESFSADTPLTALSGGQSRALMIADTAYLSASTVVLVDEIENAGIDRHRALALLANQEKIVLIATHDPLLALIADRRLIVRHGGIHQIIETSGAEKRTLRELEAVDKKLTALRARLRAGDRLDAVPS